MGVTFVVFAISVLAVTLGGYGLNPDNINIIDLGVPLLESQVVYGAGLIVLMLWMDYGYGVKWFFSPEDGSRDRKKWNTVVFLGLWAVTFLVWSSQEIPIYNNFVIGNIPPNNEFFPYSDAKSYDKNAILMMIGSGREVVYTRVLYVFFLSLAHSIVGFDYTKIILVQTLLLALIPPILFLVGKEMHSTGTGIVIGLFSLLRELNNILAGNLTTVSNSKLLLSDVPTLLVVSIIALNLIRWVKKPNSGSVSSLVLGGWLGVGVLLRSQAGVLIFVVLILCLAMFWGRWAQCAKKAAFIVAGILLVISPILMRNYQISGAVSFDESGYLAVNLRRLDPTGKYLILDPSSSGVEIYVELVKFIFYHPGVVIKFTFDHFMRNVLSTFFIIPVRLEQITNWKDLFYITTPFWREVNQNNGFLNTVLIIVNVVIFYFGIIASQRKRLWPTLSVLGIYIFYIFSSSLGRFSGWRFALPVDWVGYAFFVIGLTEIPFIFLGNGNSAAAKNSFVSNKAVARRTKWIYLQLAVVIFLGWGSVIFEQFQPKQDSYSSKEELCSRASRALESYDDQKMSSEDFLEYCMQETIIVKEGIGLYPEYFEKNCGYSDASEKRDLEAVKDFSRFVFALLGEGQTNVYVRTNEDPPYFPNGGATIVLGKKSNYGFEADLVFFGEDYQNLIVADGFDLSPSFKEVK